MIKQLTISGFRGFGQTQAISFALPREGKRGSGLTIITGANNSGKTTIIEAIRAFLYSGTNTPTFSEGRRNKGTDERVSLKLVSNVSGNDKEYTIQTISKGSSTEKNENFTLHYHVVQSRRYMNYEFGRGVSGRNWYLEQSGLLQNQRTSSLSNFETRIFQIEKDKAAFDTILSQVLGSDLDWMIEQRDSGQYYIKYTKNGVTHSSEGVGDGIWSIFTICAAFFDLQPGETVLIDEPELSLHPALQKRLLQLFLDYSEKNQIILCTHSPYFINWEAIVNGAELVRVVKEGNNSKCYSALEDTRSKFRGIIRDINNPHALGIEANEAFFLEDKIILVEGQEDVVIYNKIAEELGLSFEGTFFGWGVGGASKMQAFLSLFRDLGYQHVVAIFDGDKAAEAEAAQAAFPAYHVKVLEKPDIRDKDEQKIEAKSGLTNTKGHLKEEMRGYAEKLIKDVNAALS